LIADGKRGVCGVRENQGGKLYSLVYGMLVSAAVDPVEKKPLFHFLPGSYSYSIATAGCNFRCDFCQNWQISQVGKGQGARVQGPVLGEAVLPEQVVKGAFDNKCRSIAYTYTEPTIFFEFAFDCAKLAREKGLKNIFVTNGYVNPPAVEAIAPYLDAANVDLKSFRDDYYRQICGGKLAPVLAAIKQLKELGIWVELTTLLIPGLNDSDEELTELAGFIKNEVGADVPWHVSAFRPTYKMTDRPPTPPETLLRAREIGQKTGLRYVYTGNAHLPEAEDTYCHRCRTRLIGRAGFRVSSNVLKQGKCPKCGTAAAGVWG
jgi:pyruvate formate lyase activating enzyme